MALDAEQCLSLARSRIHGAPLDDLGSRLGLANLPYGLAKILWVQQEMGLKPDASFEATADFAITRNRTRWSQGFAYGGLVTWSGPFMVLDLKPNACGMLVGGLDCLPELTAWTGASPGSTITVDVLGEKAEWDFETSNHFFQVYQAVWTGAAPGPQPNFVFILHGSGDEHRHLLYYDRDDFAFRTEMKVFNTPWGPLHLMLGADAEAYYAHYFQAEAFAKARREAFARHVLGPYIPVAHSVHQGMLAPGNMALGSQWAVPGEVYPFAQQEKLPAYLLTLPSHKTTGLLPHGSGYLLPSAATRVEVEGSVDGERTMYLCDPQGTREPVLDIRALDYTYRGTETLAQVMASDSGRIAAQLLPLLRITAQGVRTITQ